MNILKILLNIELNKSRVAIHTNPNNKSLPFYSIAHYTRNLQLSESVSEAHT